MELGMQKKGSWCFFLCWWVLKHFSQSSNLGGRKKDVFSSCLTQSGVVKKPVKNTDLVKFLYVLFFVFISHLTPQLHLLCSDILTCFLPYPVSSPEMKVFCQQLKTSQIPSHFSCTWWKTLLTEQHPKREWANPWKKNWTRPIKYKGISLRMLEVGVYSWQLPHSCLPCFHNLQ